MSISKVNKNTSASVASFLTEGKIDVCQNVNRATESEWCLDSGCSSHSCRDLNLFAKVDKSQGGQVKLGSDASAEMT